MALVKRATLTAVDRDMPHAHPKPPARRYVMGAEAMRRYRGLVHIAVLEALTHNATAEATADRVVLAVERALCAIGVERAL